MKYAIIHADHAHRDELLALGLAYAANAIAVDDPVYRRDPEPAELEDSEVLVLDVGGRHQPEKMNFDHHQLPRGTRECALSLLAKRLHQDGVSYHELLESRPWYKFTIVVDACGPFVAAADLGLKELPKALGSPLEWAVTDAVSKMAVVEHWAKELLRRTMADRVRDALRVRERVAWLRANARIVELQQGLEALVIADADEFGVGDFREELVAGGHNVAVSVMHDERGVGWKLYRFNNQPRVDFSVLEGDPAILFAHKGGFIAKTRERLPLEAVMALVVKALV